MSNIKISLAGDLGSGKSTVGKILAAEFHAELYSTGTIQRKIATEMGMTTLQLNQYMETHPEIDGKIDDGLRALENEPKNLIIDSRMAWLPLMTALGSIGRAGAAALLVQGLVPTDGFAVGAGFGYYSLSSIFIADLRSVELGTVALLCNIMREIFTLLAVPLVARWAGPLAAISIGGATTFDTTLPVITQASGQQFVIVSIYHGFLVDFSVPFLVTLCCGL